MREQQIVITLKPEQFAQVQKLSKAAGAKSMGIFVRKALLAALDIDAAGKGSNARAAQANPAELLALAEELKRMHIELRQLVSEEAIISDSARAPANANDNVRANTGTGSNANDNARSNTGAAATTVGAQQAAPARANQPSPKDPRATDRASAAGGSDEDPQSEDNESDIEEGNYSFADSGAGFADDPLNDLLDHSLMERLQDFLAHSRAEQEQLELESIEITEPNKQESTAELDEDDDPATPSSPANDEEKAEFIQQIPPKMPKNQDSSDISGGPPPKKGI